VMRMDDAFAAAAADDDNDDDDDDACGAGWVPDGDLSKNYDPFDYIWTPPDGPKQGLRLLKIRLPAEDPSDQFHVVKSVLEEGGRARRADGFDAEIFCDMGS
jgi:hypothetical protein